MLTDVLRDAVVNGELSRDADVDALAWHFLGVLQALLNLPQAGASADALDRMIDIALSVWPIPPHTRVRSSKTKSTARAR